MSSESYTLVTQRAARISLVATTVTVVIKLVAASLTGSVSVLAEAVQSGVDVIIGIGVLQTLKLASQPADESHPYGHGKAELLMTAGQMLLILTTSGFIILQSYERWIHHKDVDADLGAVAMLVSAAINLATTKYLTGVVKQTKSTALEGEILHLRGDFFSCLGIMLGLVAVHLTGWHWLDPLIAMLFTAWVAVVALRQLIALAHPLMDGALPESDLRLLRAELDRHPMVRGFHDVRTRSVGSHRIVDLHVLLDDDLTFVQAHEEAESIESHLSQSLGGATVTIHYEPYEEELRHRAEVHNETN